VRALSPFDVDAVSHMAQFIFEDTVTPDAAEFWHDIKLSVGLRPDTKYVQLMIWGKRKKDSETSTMWEWHMLLTPPRATNVNILMEKIEKLYRKLREYDSCDCALAGIKWHPDHDGDLVVPEYLQHQCPAHGGIEFITGETK
jgi:hypothetical protein